MPEGDTLVRTAAGLRPYLVGRTVDGGVAPASPGPQADRLVGATVTGVEAQGKNLLIRFDNGLEVRTHLRMHGSWHRYRPGERWRRPPSRARLVLEVPGSVAVCFDAPTVELFEQRTEALHPSLSRLGPDLLKRAGRRRRGGPPAARPVAGDHRRSPWRCSTSGRSPASATRSRTRSCGRRRVSPFRPVARRGRRDAPRARRAVARDVLREGAATGRRPRHIYGRAGRPVPALRRRSIRSEHQAAELPRLTYWCPRCQPDPRERFRRPAHHPHGRVRVPGTNSAVLLAFGSRTRPGGPRQRWSNREPAGPRDPGEGGRS